jgi:hypothetical protein
MTLFSGHSILLWNESSEVLDAFLKTLLPSFFEQVRWARCRRREAVEKKKA